MVPRCHRVAGKTSNLGMNWSTLQKRKKKAKQHDISDDVEEDDVNDVREKLHPPQICQVHGRLFSPV